MLLTKRKKFFIVSILLSWGFFAVQLTPLSYRYLAILVLSVFSYILSAWSLLEDLDGIEWILNLVLPTIFLPSLALFYFLFPSGNLLRLFILVLAALGQYGVLLSANIFSVAVIRTIQLLRAAQAVGFLLTLLVAFFLFDTLFSFKLFPYLNAIVSGLIAFPLIWQSLWQVKLDKKDYRALLFLSLSLSFILAQLAYLISLWPVNILIASLFLVSILYIMLSLMQHHLNARLFKQTMVEYLRIGALIFVLTFLMARWG